MAHDAAVFIMGMGAGGVLMGLVGKEFGDIGGSLKKFKERWKDKIAKDVVFYSSVAQVIANATFGIGSVVGKMGLPNMNPVIFATVREMGACGILCSAAYWNHGMRLPSSKDGSLWRAALCGLTVNGTSFAVVVGQFLFLVGLKMSSAVTASVWQPSQPIWTLLIAIILGREEGNRYKVGGVILAFLGCVFMVAEASPQKGVGHTVPAWIPNLCFFGNCLGTPVYVLTSKALIVEYPSLWVTAWSYTFASMFLIAITLVINSSKSLLDLMCPPPDELCGDGWEIPPESIWALLYWIFFVSALAYALITWGNQHLEASRVSAYFALQPVMAAVVSTMVVIFTSPPHYGLRGPGPQHLGAFGVFAGLYLVVKGSGGVTTQANHQA